MSQLFHAMIIAGTHGTGPAGVGGIILHVPNVIMFTNGIWSFALRTGRCVLHEITPWLTGNIIGIGTGAVAPLHFIIDIAVMYSLLIVSPHFVLNSQDIFVQKTALSVHKLASLGFKLR